jgi:cytochrome P450
MRRATIHSEALGAPPVLRGRLPIVGALPALARDPLTVLAQAREIGDVVRLAVPGRHALFVLADPAHIRYVLQENDRNYRRTPFHDRLKVILGEGLVTSEGELWRQQRHLLQPAFRAERIRGFVRVMREQAEACAVRWQQAAEKTAVLDVSREMSDLALQIVVRCMFGQDTHEELDVRDAVHEAQAWISDRLWSLAPDWTERLPTRTNRRFRRSLATLNGAVESIIARRLRTTARDDDLLGMLVTAQQAGESIKARQLRDEVMTLLLAGHETSATVLAWAWHLLGENPSAAEGISAEVKQTIGPSRGIEAEDLASQTVTRAVIQETMRLYPPAAWFARLAAGPDRIGGFAIPSGAIVLLSPWLTQRDRRFWSDPDRFAPERFVSHERPSAYTYFPFGGGPRTCLGNHFAMTEMLVVLATLVPHLRLVHAQPGVPVRTELLLMLRPAGGLLMRPVERKQSEPMAPIDTCLPR